MFQMMYDNYGLLSGDERAFKTMSEKADELMTLQGEKLTAWAEEISAYAAAFGVE